MDKGCEVRCSRGSSDVVQRMKVWREMTVLWTVDGQVSSPSREEREAGEKGGDLGLCEYFWLPLRWASQVPLPELDPEFLPFLPHHHSSDNSLSLTSPQSTLPSGLGR